MPQLIAKRFFIAGRVQGVFFRASTRDQALRLGLRGHALNLADGRVEVLALGVPESVAVLAQWLRRGPPAAQVLEVVEEDFEFDVAQLPTHFTTG